eukprot:6256611-Amphidinium_carterae.1
MSFGIVWNWGGRAVWGKSLKSAGTLHLFVLSRSIHKDDRVSIELKTPATTSTKCKGLPQFCKHVLAYQ